MTHSQDNWSLLSLHPSCEDVISPNVADTIPRKVCFNSYQSYRGPPKPPVKRNDAR